VEDGFSVVGWMKKGPRLEGELVDMVAQAVAAFRAATKGVTTPQRVAGEARPPKRPRSVGSVVAWCEARARAGHVVRAAHTNGRVVVIL
jgi:hypothetical protein